MTAFPKGLSPCSECARHGVVGAPCPFCGCALPRARGRVRRAVGPLTRAAIFTGATVLAACGGSSATDDTANDAVLDDTAGDDTAGDDTAGDDGAGDGAGDGADDEREQSWVAPDGSCCPPYGAPPASDAIV